MSFHWKVDFTYFKSYCIRDVLLIDAPAAQYRELCSLIWWAENYDLIRETGCVWRGRCLLCRLHQKRVSFMYCSTQFLPLFYFHQSCFHWYKNSCILQNHFIVTVFSLFISYLQKYQRCTKIWYIIVKQVYTCVHLWFLYIISSQKNMKEKLSQQVLQKKTKLCL